MVGGVVLVGSATAAGCLGSVGLERLVNGERLRELQRTARLIEAAVYHDGLGPALGAARSLAQALAVERVYVVLFDAQGHIEIDTRGEASATRLLGQAEVRQALTPGREWGTDRRPAGPNGEDYLIVARQLAAEGRSPAGILWLSCPAWTGGVGRATLVALVPAGVAAAVGAGALGVLLHLRFRRHVLHHAVQTLRGLAVADAAAQAFTGAGPPADAVGATEGGVPPALDAAVRGLQRRLNSQTERLQRQRGLLQSLVNQMGEGVVVAGPNGRLVLLNPAAVRLLNLSAAPLTEWTLPGAAVESVIPHHALQRLLLRDEEHAPAEPVRLKVDTAAGPIWVQAQAFDVQLPDGESPGRAVVLTDITDLERLLQVRTDFVANASHELRTPLSTIRAAVETLLSMDLTAEAAPARGFLEKVARQSRRLEQLVLDLLDLARLESPAERFEPESLDVRQWLADVHTRFADALENRSLQWRGEIVASAVAEWRVNTLLLNLVADNLVDNAIKFTPAGGQVGLRVAVGPAETTVEVCDTGCGIPPEEQERVFERFYQVERSRSGPQRGTGLGLAIVRHAAAAMGGRVRLESRVGQGTRVTLCVPREPNA